MKSLKTILLAFALISVVFTSCKKDEEPEPGLTYEQPAIADRTTVIEIPDGLQAKSDAGDINATMAIVYMQLANAVANYASSFYLPQDAEAQFSNENEVGYFWTYGGYSYWMTYSEEGDKYVWKYDWEFPGVPRFTYIVAEENKDGKSGSWTIYDPEGGSDEVWSYVWSLDSNDNYTATLTWYEDDESNGSSMFSVVDNANGSGSFVYTIDGEEEANITWNADGSGQYWINDGDTGTSGSWDATK